MADSDEFSAVCMSREQAHVAAQRAYAHAQAMLANGETPRIACGPSTEPVTIKQRKMLHGPVLGQISEQARVQGQRYTVDAWKETFKRLLIEPVWEMHREPRLLDGRLAPPKRATPRRRFPSTEELGVRAYAKFIDDVINYAAEELGVQFEFSNEDRALLRSRPKEAT